MNDWNSETKLSQNFKLKEFEKSFVAKRKNIDNCVHDKETFKSLEKLCKNIVQPIRNYTKYLLALIAVIAVLLSTDILALLILVSMY